MAVKEEIYFLLTLIDSKEVYIRSTKFKKASEIVALCEKKNLELKQVNTERERNPVAYQTGFIMSAEEIPKAAISNFNKLWEILK